jgi:hypothetical protein
MIKFWSTSALPIPVGHQILAALLLGMHMAIVMVVDINISVY